jgi:hypothetical protein
VAAELAVRRLPVAIVALCVLGLAGSLAIPATAYSERGVSLLFTLYALAFVLVGGLLAARRPEHLVGHIMLAIGALMSVLVISGQYAGYALLGDRSLPLGLEAAWLGSWIYLPGLGLTTLLLLVFPLGRLEGGFRRGLARATVAAVAVATLVQALVPGPMDGFGRTRNPFGIDSLEGALQFLVGASALIGVLAFLTAVITVFARLRSARGDERAQLKWFAYAGGLLVLSQLPNVLPLGLDSSLAGLLLVVAGLTAMPVAVAVAVMKYRLYDIDLVIRRTLVYGALTLILGAAYLGLVLLVGLAVGRSGFATAVSTLAVAALFRPARARIQGIVDRRFYRRRYDAARTLEAFSTRLSAELRGVVGETVQPAHVSVWLRSER